MSDTARTIQTRDIFQQGHFLLSSGMHSPIYVQAALLLQDPQELERLCRDLVDRFRPLGVEAVAGPAVGGIVIAYEVARQLGVRALWTERVEGRMELRRSFALRPGERVLVVEDVVTTGASAREVRRAVEAARGRVIGIGTLVDRSGTTLVFDVPFEAVMTLQLEAHIPAVCPLCREGVPLTKPDTRSR